MRRRQGLAALALGVTLLVGCSGGSDGDSGGATTTAAPTDSSSSTTADAGETTTTVRAGAQAGLFDFNQDGTKEPTCGTADFKGGLVVRTYCDDLSGYTSEPAQGATLVPGALLSIPGPSDDPRDRPITEGASVSPAHLQAADGKEVVVFTLSSDTVFAVGSDQLQDAAGASLTNIASGLRASYPGASIQVRGHTDATGSAAANQSLSERRASAVAGFFVGQGIAQAKVSSVGLGQTVPNYKENAAVGRDQNRRIELAVRAA